MTDNATLDYYEETARKYDRMQIIDGDEHSIALSYLDGILTNSAIGSLLDVGCGTGRALAHLRDRHPDLRLAGIEPSPEMLKVCHDKGFSPDHIQVGDARQLPFADGAFDCVTAFGVLHHIADPAPAIREMCRVARTCVYISDHNVYGWGSPLSRALKSGAKRLGLWRLVSLLHTRGRGYYDTDYDGIFYPFSLLDHLGPLYERFDRVNILTTKSYRPNLFHGTSHMAVYATR